MYEHDQVVVGQNQTKDYLYILELCESQEPEEIKVKHVFLNILIEFSNTCASYYTL